MTLSAAPSTATKRVIVEMAYEEVSLSGYEFDITPEELFSALRQLDSAMANDEAQGIKLAYNFPITFGNGDLEDAAGIPDAAIEYASLRLAKSICSRMGKTLAEDPKARLAQATATVRALTAVIPNRGYPYGTVAGAGNRWARWGRRVFMPVGIVDENADDIPVVPDDGPSLDFSMADNSQYIGVFL